MLLTFFMFTPPECSDASFNTKALFLFKYNELIAY